MSNIWMFVFVLSLFDLLSDQLIWEKNSRDFLPPPPLCLIQVSIFYLYVIGKSTKSTVDRDKLQKKTWTVACEKSSSIECHCWLEYILYMDASISNEYKSQIQTQQMKVAYLIGKCLLFLLRDVFIAGSNAHWINTKHDDSKQLRADKRTPYWCKWAFNRQFGVKIRGPVESVLVLTSGGS